MIERYTRPEMGQIWTLENRYKAWLRVELAVCEAWCQEGKVPAGALANIKAKAAIDVDRILTIEETTRHDVIAFLTSLEEKIGPDARFIHLGCTSSARLSTLFSSPSDPWPSHTRAPCASAAPTACTPSPPASASR